MAVDELINFFVYRLFSTKLIVILKTFPFTHEVLENNIQLLYFNILVHSLDF